MSEDISQVVSIQDIPLDAMCDSLVKAVEMLIGETPGVVLHLTQPSSGRVVATTNLPPESFADFMKFVADNREDFSMTEVVVPDKRH